jgi:hypothetical protein
MGNPMTYDEVFASIKAEGLSNPVDGLTMLDVLVLSQAASLYIISNQRSFYDEMEKVHGLTQEQVDNVAIKLQGIISQHGDDMLGQTLAALTPEEQDEIARLLAEGTIEQNLVPDHVDDLEAEIEAMFNQLRDGNS